MATLVAVGHDPASNCSSKCTSPRVITLTLQAKSSGVEASPKIAEPELGQPLKTEEAVSTSDKAIIATTAAAAVMSTSSLLPLHPGASVETSASPAIRSMGFVIDQLATNGPINLTVHHSHSQVCAASNGNFKAKNRPFTMRALVADSDVIKAKKRKVSTKEEQSLKIPLSEIVRHLTAPLTGPHPEGISANQLDSYISQQVPDHQRICRNRNHLNFLIWRDRKLGAIVRMINGLYAAPEFVAAIEARRKPDGNPSSRGLATGLLLRNPFGESFEPELLEDAEVATPEQAAPQAKAEDGPASSVDLKYKKSYSSGRPKQQDAKQANSAVVASGGGVRKVLQALRRGNSALALKSGVLMLDEDAILMPPPISTIVPRNGQQKTSNNRGSTKAGKGTAVSSSSSDDKLKEIISSTIAKLQHGAAAAVGKRANGVSSAPSRQRQRVPPRKSRQLSGAERKVSANPGRPKQGSERALQDPAVSAERTFLLEAATKAAGWSADDVFNFISGLGFANQAAAVFREQEIDGVALLLMSRDHILSRQLPIKLGPALKLYQKIRALQLAHAQYQV